MNDFQIFLLKNRKERNIKIFYDIETLRYNEDVGKEHPSEYKNITYSVAIGYFNEHDLKIKAYPSFKHFFDEILETYKKWKKLPNIELIAHNSNKYDSHFLRHDLIYFYDLKVKNLYLMNATDKGNVNTLKKKKLSDKDKKGIILEKRIKSSNNIELDFYINNIRFYSTDNLVKTSASIATLGKKLHALNIISEDDLKTDFDYDKYNRPYDMTNSEAYEYAVKVFNNLTDEEMLYIRNDIIILAESVRNYSRLFQGFSYEKITFTSNILEYYNDNNLTSYQLLKSIGKGKEKKHVKYTDYIFHNENFYDYLKSFYAGGLNFYNDLYVGQIINEPVIALDINSSYPYAMHNFKVPTHLHSFQEYEENVLIDIEINDDFFYMYRLDKKVFDNEILMYIDSKIGKQMLAKYYNKKDNININTYTIKILQDIFKINIKQLPVLSYVCFKCEYFGSREKIAEKYYVKEQGSNDKKIIYNSPYDIQETKEKNTEVFTQEEIDISKIILNGLYGIPALRSHFNIFRWIGNELINITNGYENNERNIVFSVFVTAVSLYNLLYPLKDLTGNEIDDNFLYCDTDSLYLKKSIEHKIDKNIFHDFHLGKWSIEHPKIEKFIVINHKKYAYYGYNYKKKEHDIFIKCGGIPNDSFNKKMSFEKFVETQFTHGIKIKNKKSIYNKQGTITIYDSETELQVGDGYQLFTDDSLIDEQKEKMFEEIRQATKEGHDDILYIESSLGSFSLQDIYPHKHEIKNKTDLKNLLIYERSIRREL